MSFTKDDTNVRLYMEDPNNCEYIALVECVGGERNVIPNILILNGKQHLEKYFKENNLENNIYLAVSNSAYFNDEIGVQLLEHFDKYIRKKQKEAWKMLIMDAASSSHINEKFVKICYSKNIFPF